MQQTIPHGLPDESLTPELLAYNRDLDEAARLLREEKFDESIAVLERANRTREIVRGRLSAV